jgi:hypothetical protein
MLQVKTTGLLGMNESRNPQVVSSLLFIVRAHRWSISIVLCED